MVFGHNPAGPAILATLNLTPRDVGRYRDCFVTAEDEIAVYTRNGGGNREEYQVVFDVLRNHPLYIRDADDEFDSTYATIYFRLPEEYAEDLRKIALKEPFDPSKRWLDMLDKIREGPPTQGKATK